MMILQWGDIFVLSSKLGPSIDLIPRKKNTYILKIGGYFGCKYGEYILTQDMGNSIP